MSAKNSQTSVSKLPSYENTLFLRACLWSGKPAQQAWYGYCRRTTDFLDTIKQDSYGIKRHLPLLFDSIQRNDVAIESRLSTCLKTAYFRELLRCKVYWNIYRDVMSLLKDAGISTVTLKGSSLAFTTYADPALRHCHDIDFLIDEIDIKQVSAILSSAAFRPPHKHLLCDQTDLIFQHTSGLDLVFHSRLFNSPEYNIPFGHLWHRGRTEEIAGTQSRILSIADNLMHVGAHAFYSGRLETLGWVCDSWQLLKHFSGPDWHALAELAKRDYVGRPLSIVLGYLSKELRAQIPSDLMATEYEYLGKVPS